MTKETKLIASSMKITLNAVIALVIAAGLLLLNFFVIDGINAGDTHSLAYWLRKILTAMGTFMVMISVSNVTEESRKRKDRAYTDRLDSLDDFYQRVNARALTERIEFYILQKNIKAKYVAFVKKYKKKLARTKDEAERKAIEEKLLLSPQDVWSGAEKVRYAKITYSLLISGATDVNSNEEENDLHTHRADLIIKKMVWKALGIVGFGMYAPEIIDHFKAFTTADILPLVLRVATILWAIYTGVCFGYLMLDRILVVLKRKIKVFSEFEARTNNPALTDENRYLIAYELDGQVEKIKAKYGVTQPVANVQGVAEEHEQEAEPKPTPPQNALQQVYAESFGNHKPITPAKAVSSLIKLHVQKQLNNQEEQAQEA